MFRDLDAVLDVGIDQRASDIVFTRSSPVAFKINGKWAFTNAEPLAPEKVKTLIYSVLSPQQIARFERERELDFSFEVVRREPPPPEAPAEAAPVMVGHRFRGNLFQQRGTIGAALRLIPKEVPSIRALGLPAILETFALKPQGLFLVTGPTGHGKTTTLASMIDVINTNRRAHIVTVEDPVEYVHKNKMAIIEQREVFEDTLSFGAALRHVLRQAPDVIMVGEMRDPETISAALTAAETGHLVLATLHTNDAAKTIDRIIDSYPPYQQTQVRAQLALTLEAIVSPRLISTQDGRGRVVAVELLINTLPVQNLIREQKIYQIYSVMETSSKDGMIVLDASLRQLYFDRKISLAEAKARMRNPASLEQKRASGSEAAR